MVTRTIMWFRRDLRLGDHPALLAATADGAEVVPLFVVDPTFAEAGGPRLAHLHDCLRSLDRGLRDHGSPGLLIRHGDPTHVVPELAEEVGADSVVVSRDYSPYGRSRDAAVGAALTVGGRKLRGVGSPYAVDPGRVRKGDGTPYSVFTPFSKVWRRAGWDAPHPTIGDDVRWAAGIPSDDLDERPSPDCDLPEAGEDAALERWRAFLDVTGAGDGTMRSGVQAYDDLRDLPAVGGTSRLSPDLKWGTIHPRTLLADLDASGDGERGHTVFSSELAWRDFYADVLFQKPNTAWENLNPKYDHIEIDTDAAAEGKFDLWSRGETGFGIVDAGMRQLRATGWMHNRVRMIVASFLVKDLHLPWQWGARWFMTHLVDGDLASNNHGWQWAAGTGTDAAPYFRVFNPTLQEERYDPDGAYVARWVPDGIEPMVDHKVERDEALRRLQALSAVPPSADE
ncbi:MAG: deoxyribodipyrimidine photo-lyase [Ilumatobacter sp.]|uniref:cryptochrome/photolyase family protein n=1 Tax=Ilumatobacter sp. TaxID=1967498 RepID=UPI00329A3BBC